MNSITCLDLSRCCLAVVGDGMDFMTCFEDMVWGKLGSCLDDPSMLRRFSCLLLGDANV